MGGTKSKDSTYYDPTLNAELVDQTKQCKIYRNEKGEQYEKYRVKHKGNYDFDNRYEYRIKNSSPYLVDAYSAKSSHNAFGCASSDQYEVVTERMPHRLFEMGNLAGVEALNMANKALKGFQQIFKSQGVLLVKDSMIGVNKQQNVKVWMNSNFALNQIEQLPISYGVLSDSEKQSTMVDNIIELINSRSQRDQLWVQFVEEKYRQGRVGFDQAINLTQIQASRHNVSLLENASTGIAVPNISRKATQQPKDILYPAYENGTKNSSIKNSGVIGSEKSLAYNPTVTSSLTNPMNLVSSNNPLEITQQQMFTPVTNSNYNAGVKVANQPPQGIAGLKSRILHGQAMNKNQMVTSVYNINQMPPTKNYPRPLASNSVDSSKKPVITQPIPQPIPQPVHFPAPPPQFVPNGRPVMGIQTNRPRTISSGKPVVTFGNKVISSGPTQYPNNTKPFPIPQISVQTPVQGQVRIHTSTPNQVATNPQPSIKQPIVLQLNQPTKYQICPAEAKLDQKIVGSSPVEMKLNFLPKLQPIAYPPPGKVVNFQRKIEVAESKYVDTTPIVIQQRTEHNVNIVEQPSIPAAAKQKQQKKQQKPAQVASQVDTHDISKKQNIQSNQVVVETRITEVSAVQNQDYMGRIQVKSMGLGVTTSIDGKTNDEAWGKYQTAQKQLKNEFQQQQTPFFGKQSKINNVLVVKNREFSQNQVDRILEYEQEQLKNFKQTQVKSFGIKQAESKEQELTASMKENIENTIKEPIIQQPEVKVKENNNSLSNSQKRESQQVKKTAGKDESNFKMAVKESASNIRMQTSKISIRSSSDLKGIISYKDLRDLLKTTRRQPTH